MFNGRVLTRISYNIIYIDKITTVHNNSLGLLKKRHRWRRMQAAAGEGVRASLCRKTKIGLIQLRFPDPKNGLTFSNPPRSGSLIPLDHDS
jgi:hypothetical protein